MNNTEESKFVELIGKIPNVAVQGYDKNRNVIYWNKASENIYGYTKEEAFGKKLEELIIPKTSKDDVILAHENWFKNNIPISSSELELVHKSGKTVYVYSSHVMLKENTKSPEMFCIDVDLTKQVQKDLELKEKDKILTSQSKMAGLGEMIDNIAHQWRQPLSMILSVASGVKLQNNYSKLSTEYLNSSLESIIDTTKYLSQTIEDFRDFIRGTHEKKTFNLFDNLKRSFELLDGVVKENNINVIISTPLNQITIHGYPNELIQVIINLVSNSKDAFNELNIKNRYIFCEIKKEKDSVILNIKDNAKGINLNIIKDIFNSHFTTKKDNLGTGVGLYMSKRLITESMNGTIEVLNVSYKYEESDFKGALFKITLPLNKESK